TAPRAADGEAEYLPAITGSLARTFVSTANGWTRRAKRRTAAGARPVWIISTAAETSPTSTDTCAADSSVMPPCAKCFAGYENRMSAGYVGGNLIFFTIAAKRGSERSGSIQGCTFRNTRKKSCLA